MTKRIRIVEIIYSFAVAGPGGGAARFGMELGRRLDKSRFEVTICGLWELGTSFEQERIEKLRAGGNEAFTATEWDSNRPYSSFWRALQWMRSTLSRKPAHILHSHSEFGDVAALLLKASSKPPIIVRTVHNGYRYEWRKRPLRRLLLTNCLYPMIFSAEIGVNRSIVKNLNQRWVAKLLGQQAIYLPNAIDLERFTDVEVDTAEKRAALHLPPDALVVGTVGRLVEGKGYETFLEAAAIVLKELPQVYFLLVGSGKLADPLRSLAHRLGIADHVIFSGLRSDVEGILACLDLFISSSLWEGLSTVILEAIASKVPVVATNIPGNQGIIKDQFSGWLVPPNDSEAMAEMIIKALRSPSLRDQYARQALRIVEAFSIDAVAAEHEALYVQLQSQKQLASTYGCNSTSNSPASKI